MHKNKMFTSIFIGALMILGLAFADPIGISASPIVSQATVFPVGSIHYTAIKKQGKVIVKNISIYRLYQSFPFENNPVKNPPLSVKKLALKFGSKVYISKSGYNGTRYSWLHIKSLKKVKKGQRAIYYWIRSDAIKIVNSKSVSK